MSFSKRSSPTRPPGYENMSCHLCLSEISDALLSEQVYKQDDNDESNSCRY